MKAVPQVVNAAGGSRFFFYQKSLSLHNPKLNYMLKRIPFLLTLLLALCTCLRAQVTNSSMSGFIKSDKGEPLVGATITATHTPTGTVYRTVSRSGGRFNITNMVPGGPYSIGVTFVGLTESKKQDIYLNLGEPASQDFVLTSNESMLREVVVAGKRAVPAVAKGGVETVIGRDRMLNAPSVGRNLADYFRLVPQAKTTFGGGISIAGQNNRYNQLMIDGATNNDNFGISDQGTNGGQTGAPPISIDAIESIQVGISPYDVSLGNFTGGSINAITKSGTNRIQGSAYFVYRNRDFAGKTPTGDKSAATRLNTFTNKTYGFTVGGPIIKNKLFYFLSGEILDNVIPQPFNIGSFKAAGVQDSINLIINKLNGYGYNPGEYLNIPDKLKSNKIAAKITWNVNEKNRLTLSYRYTKSDRYITTASTSSRINFFNNGYLFPSTTNSGSAELTSAISNSMSNKLLVTLTKVFDDRNPIGTFFPRVTLNSVNATSYIFGSENFSTANQLKQNNFNIFDEFKWNVGAHQLKAGVDVEWSKSYNLFIRDAFGTYTYNYVNDFLNDLKPSAYSRSFSLVDNIIGDGSAAAPTFKTLRFGAFIGDEWTANEQFKLNYGLRFDQFVFLDKPNEDVFFNNNAIPAISQYWDLFGARSGQQPKAQLSISPRIGFTYTIPDENMKIRGGFGFFTGRVPLVWPGGVYNNSGITVGGVSVNNPAITFRPDIYNQYTPADFGQTVKVPSGQIDLIAKDFKLPKVLKTSLGVDKRLGSGFNLSMDLLVQKNINEVTYTNVYGAPGGKNSLGQDVYLNSNLKYNGIDMDLNTPGYQNPYSTGIFIIRDATDNKGFAYNFSVMLDKAFAQGWTANASYTYGDSYSIFDGGSSQNSSQWRFMSTATGRNNLMRSRSDFAQLHRINAYLSKKFEYANKSLATTVTLFYNGQSGTPYSYVYTRSMIYDYNGSSTETNDLIYVPRNLADWQRFAIPYTDNSGTHSVQEQWNALDRYISNDKYLNKIRGQFTERNGAILPFSHQIDLNIKQDFSIKTKENKNTLTLQFDIFNFTNFLNRDWGRIYVTPNVNAYSLINMEGYTYTSGVFVPKFTYRNLSNKTAADVLDVRGNAYNASRWRGQVTIRYTFN
jgi:hypothetical protein